MATAGHFSGPRERGLQEHEGGLLPKQKDGGSGSTWAGLPSKYQRYLFMLKVEFLFDSWMHE